MTGRISKYAWAYALQRFLMRKHHIRLRDLKKPWEKAYFNWLKAREIFQEEFDMFTSQIVPSWQPKEVLSQMCPCCFYRESSEYGPDYPIIGGLDANFQLKRRKFPGGRKILSRQPPVSKVFLSDAVDPDPAPKFDSSQSEALDTQGTSTASVLQSDLAEPNVQYSGESITSTTKEAQGGDPISDLLDKERCPHHFYAAVEEKETIKRFKNLDQTGLMNYCCRHNITTSLLNIYRGEKFFYGVHIVQSLLGRLPLDAHLILQYDIGCKFGPHLRRKYPEIYSRVRCCMNAFHSYAHALGCQLTYSPLRTPMAGLSDGEGVERDWSFKSHLVTTTRISLAIHREILLNEQTLYRGQLQRQQLGFHLNAKFKRAMIVIEEAHKTFEIVRTHLISKDLMSSTDDLGNILNQYALEQSEWFSKKIKAKKLAEIERPFEHLFRLLIHEENMEATLRKREIQDPGSVDIPVPVSKRPSKSGSLAAWNQDGMMTLRQMRDQAVLQCDEELQRTKQSRDQWLAGGDLRKHYGKSYIWHQIEEQFELAHKQAAARVQEFRNIKRMHDTRGTKGAALLHTQLTKNLPQLQKRLKLIKALMDQLPASEPRPQEITLQTFSPAELEKESNYRLWNYELAQARGLGVERDVGDLPLRPFLDDVYILNGIDAFYRYQRAKEELQLLNQEWARLARWLIDRLQSLLLLYRGSLASSTRHYAKTLLMETIITAESALSCCEDIIDEVLRAKLIGIF